MKTTQDCLTIGVFGDMRELGSLEQERHESFADHLSQHLPDVIILVGPMMKKYTNIPTAVYTLDAREAGRIAEEYIQGQTKKIVVFAK